MAEQISRKVRKDISLKLIIIITVAVLALAGILAGIFAYRLAVEKNIIDDNVFVNFLPVGGLTVEEAAQKIEQNVSDEYFNRTVSVKYLDDEYEINLAGNVSVNADETAKEALLIKTKGEKKVIPFNVTVNLDNLKKDVSLYFSRLENKNDMFLFNNEYTSVEVDSSKTEQLLDVDKTVEIVYENIKNDNFESVDGAVIKNGDEGFDDALYSRLSRSPQNATVGLGDDESTYIIPEVVGIEADKNAFLKLYSENNGRFEIDVKPTFPEILTKDLDIKFYQDVLGSYTSTYNAGLVNRTKNVSLAAGYVNGTVIMPGQRFSYNNVVGKRTAERGFLAATVYTGEGTEEGLGGGICQVSSTIYCAQLRANLKTVSRKNHSYTVVYVPLGQDATVSYGYLDYVFENDTNYPIKIETSMGGGRLTVRILGTKVDKSLTYDIVSVTNSTTPMKEIVKETTDLYEGVTQVKQNGQNGAVVSTYKIYYKDGVEQKREYIGKSTYIPMNKIVLVGTAPLPPSEDANGETPSETVGNTEPGTKPDEGEAVEIPDTGDASATEEADVSVTDDGTDIPTSDTGL